MNNPETDPKPENKVQLEAGGDCPSAPCSAWVSVADRLPPAGLYVLVHLTKGNWKDSEDPKGVYNVVAKLRMGLSKEDRERMKRGELPDPDYHGYIAPGGHWENVTSKRSDVTKAEDEAGNNLRAYNWSGFGNGDYWGQEVDYWMPIPSLPNAQADL